MTNETYFQSNASTPRGRNFPRQEHLRRDPPGGHSGPEHTQRTRQRYQPSATVRQGRRKGRVRAPVRATGWTGGLLAHRPPGPRLRRCEEFQRRGGQRHEEAAASWCQETASRAVGLPQVRANAAGDAARRAGSFVYGE